MHTACSEPLSIMLVRRSMPLAFFLGKPVDCPLTVTAICLVALRRRHMGLATLLSISVLTPPKPPVEAPAGLAKQQRLTTSQARSAEILTQSFVTVVLSGSALTT